MNDPATPLDLHLRATREGNVKLLREAFMSGGRFVGTDDMETWSTEELCALLTRNPIGWRMDMLSRRMYTVSAGVYEFLEFLSHVKYGSMRASGLVMKCDDERWRILSYVLSCSVPNSALEGENLPMYMKLIGAAQ